MIEFFLTTLRLLRAGAGKLPIHYGVGDDVFIETLLEAAHDLLVVELLVARVPSIIPDHLQYRLEAEGVCVSSAAVHATFASPPSPHPWQAYE